MQLESQFVRIQLQEYRSNKFVKNTSKQLRVYNVPVADLMNLIAASVQKAAEPEPNPLPVAAVTVAKTPKTIVDPSATRQRRILSQESKDKIAATQRLKWATRPRKLPQEVKDRIADSQRERWATRRQTWSEMQTNPVNGTVYVGAN
jgi:hypothetical protein